MVAVWELCPKTPVISLSSYASLNRLEVSMYFIEIVIRLRLKLSLNSLFILVFPLPLLA